MSDSVKYYQVSIIDPETGRKVFEANKAQIGPVQMEVMDEVIEYGLDPWFRNRQEEYSFKTILKQDSAGHLYTIFTEDEQ